MQTIQWLRISARVSDVDFKKGTIIFNSNKDTKYHKMSSLSENFINKDKTDHPLAETWRKSLRVSRDHGDYVKFAHSDLTTDSGQTAVPFWDAQPVAPIPSVPLGGIGFYWKNFEHSGGFVAPVVVPVEYDQIFDELLPLFMNALINNYTNNWDIMKFECENECSTSTLKI